MRERFGKYRGIVMDAVDPLGRARIKVIVPAISGQEAQWAEACLAPQWAVSTTPPVPALGSIVWIEFEAGDPHHPIWVGQLWNEVPAPPALPAGGLHTSTGSVSLVETPDGGFTMTVGEHGSISIGPSGIVLTNHKGASITMTGPTVSVNSGALVVT